MNAVLATDMTQHMRLLDSFSEGRSEQPDLVSWGDSDVLLQLVLHTADLCNPCRPLLFSIKWGELICCEFLEQVTLLCICRLFILSDGQPADRSSRPMVNLQTIPSIRQFILQMSHVILQCNYCSRSKKPCHYIKMSLYSEHPLTQYSAVFL